MPRTIYNSVKVAYYEFAVVCSTMAPSYAGCPHLEWSSRIDLSWYLKGKEKGTRKKW